MQSRLFRKGLFVELPEKRDKVLHVMDSNTCNEILAVQNLAVELACQSIPESNAWRGAHDDTFTIRHVGAIIFGEVVTDRIKG